MPELNRVTQSFVLDFRRPAVNRLKVVNGDTANTFVITLKDGGKAVSLNTDLHKVIAVFKRADGQVYTQDANTGVSFTATGVVTIDVRPASFRSGTNTVELQVYKRESNAATTYPLLATTYPQAFTARNETLTGEGENAPSQLPMLEQIIHDAGEATTSANNAAAAANAAAEFAHEEGLWADERAQDAAAAASAANTAAAAAGIAAGNANNASANAALATTAANNAASAANAAAALAEQAARDIDHGYPVTIGFYNSVPGGVPVIYSCDHTYAQIAEYYNQNRPMFAVELGWTGTAYKIVGQSAGVLSRKNSSTFTATLRTLLPNNRVKDSVFEISSNNQVTQTDHIFPAITQASISNGVISFKDEDGTERYSVTLPLYDGGVE